MSEIAKKMMEDRSNVVDLGKCSGVHYHIKSIDGQGRFLIRESGGLGGFDQPVKINEELCLQIMDLNALERLNLAEGIFTAAINMEEKKSLDEAKSLVGIHMSSFDLDEVAQTLISEGLIAIENGSIEIKEGWTNTLIDILESQFNIESEIAKRASQILNEKNNLDEEQGFSFS